MPHPSRRAPVALALAAALIAGCSGAERIEAGGDPALADASTLRAAMGGERVLEVFGAPPDGATGDQIAARLSAPVGFPPTTFRAVGPGGGGLRTVFEFGVGSVNVMSCSRPRAATTRFVVMTATLCDGDRALRSARLHAPGLQGPSSPGWDGTVARLMREMLTPDTLRQQPAS